MANDAEHLSFPPKIFTYDETHPVDQDPQNREDPLLSNTRSDSTFLEEATWNFAAFGEEYYSDQFGYFPSSSSTEDNTAWLLDYLNFDFECFNINMKTLLMELDATTLWSNTVHFKKYG